MKHLKDIQASEIMQTHVVKASMNMKVSELEELFAAKKITGVPVVDDFGKLVGVVSETDIVRSDVDGTRTREDTHPYFKGVWEGDFPEESVDLEAYEDLSGKTVEDIMTPWTVTARENSSVTDLAKTMVDRSVHKALIVAAA